MTIFSDNFDDNVFDWNKWEKVFYDADGGDVIERNNRIEFYLPVAGTTYGAYAGLVSRDRYDLSKGGVSVYIAAADLNTVFLLISPHKITMGRPELLPDCYTIYLWAHTQNKCVVLKRRGGVQTELYIGTELATSNQLKIAVEAGFIRFYENGVCRYYEPYDLPSYECYIYIYGRTSVRGLPDECTGIGWADDFYCEYVGTSEEKAEAKLEILQTGIMEFIQAHWRELSVLAVIIAIVIAIILGVW